MVVPGVARAGQASVAGWTWLCLGAGLGVILGGVATRLGAGPPRALEGGGGLSLPPGARSRSAFASPAAILRSELEQGRSAICGGLGSFSLKP